MKALQAIINMPWAIHEPALRTMLEIAARMNDPAAMAAQYAPRMSDTRYVTVRDGVAIVEVTGPIARYMNLFSYFSGGTSSEILAKDFTSAFNNPSVKSILLNINSPGGSVDGTSELAGMIYDARKSGKKPIKAYISGAGCSGAYWLAAAADEIILNKTAYAGSIGVVMSCTDYSKADEMAGIEEMEFVSSNAPNKRPDPKSDEGKSLIQQLLDDTEDVFISDVARYRGVTKETVKSDFGQGGVFVGKQAVTAGLADRVGTFEEVLSGLVKGRTTPKTSQQSAVADPSAAQAAISEDQPMSWLKSLAAKLSSDEREELSTHLTEDGGNDADTPATPSATPPAASQPANAPSNTQAAEPSAEILAALEESRRQQAATSQALQALQTERDRETLTASIGSLFKTADGNAVATPATVNAGVDALLPLSAEHRTAVLGWMQSSGLVELKQRGFSSEEGGVSSNEVELTAADEKIIEQSAKTSNRPIEAVRKEFLEAKTVRFGK